MNLYRKLSCFFIGGHHDGGLCQPDAIDGSDGVADQASDLFGICAAQFHQESIFSGHIMNFLDMGAVSQFPPNLNFIGLLIGLYGDKRDQAFVKKFRV